MQPAIRPKRRATARRVALCCTLTTAISLGAVELADAASGASASRHRPTGHVTGIRQSATGLFVRGWAFDADTSRSAVVRVALDHHRIAQVVANRYRPDIGRKHPGYGNWRGFRVNTAVPAGTHTVCVRVVDYPSDRGRVLLCRTLTFDFSPFGTISALTQHPGQLTATGWAIDPNQPSTARAVVAYVDNVAVARGVAGRAVAGLTAAHPTAGANHGYAVTFPITEGTHRICVWASNVGPGQGRNIACVTRTVSFSPYGAITRLDQIPGGFAVHGYALDPDTPAPTTVTVTVNGTRLAATPANRSTGAKPGHSFDATYLIPTATLPAGNRTVCVIAKNLGPYGTDRTIQCITRYFDWNPAAGVDRVVQKWPGAWVGGWAVDPDTSAPIDAALYADGKYVMTVPAKGTGGSHSGHMVRRVIPLADGKHTICVAGVNVLYGVGTPARTCRTITLNFRPTGTFSTVARGASNAPSPAVVTGTAADPDTPGSIPVQARVDNGPWVTGLTSATTHAYRFTVPAADGEHTVCVRALDVTPTGVRTGATTALGCKILNAIHPVPPAAPGAVTAIAGYGGARITWTPPAFDGGAPWTAYTVTASPGGLTMSAGPRTTAVTMLGLKPSTRYSFSVVAINVAWRSRPGTSPVVTTEKEPPPQTSPAPISTSRYIRNVYGASSTDLATLRAEGAADAAANPSGHGYLIMLAVGGQDESRRGVVLSATIRFVSYADIVKNLQAYVAGYASRQRPSAPVTLAIATNNDIDVSRTSGSHFADWVVDPVVSYAAQYPGITIAGSDDMEPGFRAGYSATSAWLGGYLAATRAPFVFTGSADGCSWTAPNRGCNNGWTMRGMYYLTGGASPARILNLPQIYNNTMAQQWRYISLTGVLSHQPRINFGGALTEYTACKQARSCGSLTGSTAWQQMWGQLNAEPALRLTSLPYSTDLRIDR